MRSGVASASWPSWSTLSPLRSRDQPGLDARRVQRPLANENRFYGCSCIMSKCPGGSRPGSLHDKIPQQFRARHAAVAHPPEVRLPRRRPVDRSHSASLPRGHTPGRERRGKRPCVAGERHEAGGRPAAAKRRPNRRIRMSFNDEPRQQGRLTCVFNSDKCVSPAGGSVAGWPAARPARRPGEDADDARTFSTAERRCRARPPLLGRARGTYSPGASAD